MDASAVVAVCTFLALQTGSLIWFGGNVNRAIQDHDRTLGSQDTRIAEVERNAQKTALRVAQIIGELDA